jgi:hypothetical protein
MFFGVNADLENGYKQETEPFDLHCPLMGGPPERLNYWKSTCAVRQKCSRFRKTCYGGCKVGIKKVPTKGRGYQYPQYNINIKAAIDLFNSGMDNVHVAARLKLSYSSIYRYRRVAKQNGLLTVGE